MIAHSDSTLQRIFPPIQSDLYEVNCNLAELTPDQRAAQKIIALANQNFTRWERLVGWKLDSIGQIGRLLFQHRLAMEAELAAQWKRADFFWNQVLIELKALSRRHKVWQALASTLSVDEPGVVVMGDRLQLRQRFVDELLIDTHFGFYNGLTRQREKLSVKDRAFVHIDYIQKLFDLSELPENRWLSLLDKPWQQQLNLCKETGKWEQAIEICTKRLKDFPKLVHYQDELAEAHFLASLARLQMGNHQEGLQEIDEYSIKSIVFYPVYQTKNKSENKDDFLSWRWFFSTFLLILLGEILLSEFIVIYSGIIFLVFYALIVLITPILIIFLLDLFFKALMGYQPANLAEYPFPGVIDFNSNDFVIIESWLAKKVKKFALADRELKKAKKLQIVINNLKKLSKDYRYNLRIFELLAELHHLQSIKLINAGYLAEALFLVQKAITYNPYLHKASLTRIKIDKKMRELQAQVKAFEAKTARQITVNLTKKEKHLKDQARKGFTLVNAYLNSPEAQVISEAFKLSQAGSIWRIIGLNESVKGWSKKALLLFDQLNLVLNNPPQNPASIADSWKAVTIKHPTLAELDPVLIHAFLERKLFGSENEPIVTSPTPPNPPLLTPVSVKRQPGAEPFLPWFFSRQDIRLKFQAVVASVLVLTTGMVTIQDLSALSVRNSAYQKILQAEQRQELLDIVKGAEEFFSKTPVVAKDGRDRQVMELYSEALVRWVAQQGNPLDEEAKVHFERYQTVRNNLKQGGN